MKQKKKKKFSKLLSHRFQLEMCLDLQCDESVLGSTKEQESHLQLPSNPLGPSLLDFKTN